MPLFTRCPKEAFSETYIYLGATLCVRIGAMGMFLKHYRNRGRWGTYGHASAHKTGARLKREGPRESVRGP